MVLGMLRFVSTLFLFIGICFSSASAGTLEIYRLLNLFGDVFSKVRTHYVESVDDQKLIENALNGMLSALDPHSTYMNEKEFQDLKIMTTGEFGGIGVEIVPEHGVLKVITPIDDTPAFNAGIESGDYIIEIDDTPIMGMPSNEAVEKMRGLPGSLLKLKIIREGKDPFELQIKREQIKVQPVHWKIEQDIGIIRISTFIDERTGEKLLKAIKEIQERLGNKLKGIILDVRNNAGGLLEEAAAVSDIFLDEKEIVSIRGNNDSEGQKIFSNPGEELKGIPLVVLINNWTASCPEIVAGALQDHKRALILGTRSYGKGSVQTVMPLSGYGALRLTTHFYYTPLGRAIQAKGIDPDIEVFPGVLVEEKKEEFREEDLPGALKLERERFKKNKKEEEKAKEEKETKESKDATSVTMEESQEVPATSQKKEKKSPPKESFLKDSSEDYQLRRAIDLIQGLFMMKVKDV